MESRQEGQDQHKKRMSKIPFLVSKTSKTKILPIVLKTCCFVDLGFPFFCAYVPYLILVSSQIFPF